LRILQISSARALGGGERHLTDLINGLVARGHEVFAAVRPASPLIAELRNLPAQNITTLPLRNALDAMSAGALSKFVRNHDVQIVHAHMARDYPLAAYAARRNRGCRLIVTRHVLFPMNRLHYLTLSHAARVIAVSEAVREILAAQKLIPSKRIVIIPNGIEVTRFDHTERSEAIGFRQRWNIAEDSPLIGSVGELTPLKGHAEFLEAAAQVSRSFPNATFLIAGMDAGAGTPTLKALKAQIDKLGLAGQTRVLGWVENLAALYAALDIFVSASHTESFGLSIAEAMASETPVIASETMGAAEIIEREKSGLLVPIDNVAELTSNITRLLNNKDERRRLAAAGAERIRKKFSLDRMVGATEQLYEEVTSQ
jgi:glycosyltransferase involved in cell wall biosynthesis